MTALTKQLTNAELRQIIDSHEKGHGMCVPVNYGYIAAKELLAVREAQSKPAPIAFSENADADMCRTWAWEQVKKDVTTDSWTIGDSGNFYGFYCWGWDMRRQYNEQRPPAAPDLGALTKLIVGRLIDCGTANDDSIADAEVFVYNACRAAMLENTQKAALGMAPAVNIGNMQNTPAGFKLVPVDLTAENGAKASLIGEFTEVKYINCPECFGDDWCEGCDGSGRIKVEVPVTWTTIKAIWKKGIEHFDSLAAAPTPTK